MVQVFDEPQEDVTATLSGLTIWGGMTSQAGGGIYNDGTLTITNCVFTNHTSGSDGGGIANPGILTVTNSTIEDNSAPFGGGIYNEGTLNVTGSTIESNTANSSGGYGGGIDSSDGGVTTLTSTAIEMNSAVVKGGGIFNSGDRPLTVTDGTFSSNSAQSGGGIFIEGDGADPPDPMRITGTAFPRTTPPVRSPARAVEVSTTKVVLFRSPAARCRTIPPPKAAGASMQTPAH